MTMKELVVTVVVTLVVCTFASPTSHHLRHKHGHHKLHTDEGQHKNSAHKFIDTPTEGMPKEFDGMKGTLVLQSGSQAEADKTVKILREKDLERREHGAAEVFIPIPLPTDFSSYDISPKDGFISLEELSNVTGAHENAGLAFNASDKNAIAMGFEENVRKTYTTSEVLGILQDACMLKTLDSYVTFLSREAPLGLRDGKLTKDEFDNAPWSLQGDEHLDTDGAVDTPPLQMYWRKHSSHQKQDTGPIDKVAIADDDP